MRYSLSAGHEQDGQAADDRKDHGNNHQNHLRQLAAAASIRLVFHRLQGLDPAALAVVALHASVEEEEEEETAWRVGTAAERRGQEVKRALAKRRRSHADGLGQALDVFAVAVDAVAQVGGGAGVLGAAQGGGVAAGGEGVLGVLRGGASTFGLVLALAFASLSSPLLPDGMHTWWSREENQEVTYGPT